MDKQRSLPVGDASGSDLDVSKIPIPKPPVLQPAKSARSTSAKTLTDAQVLKLLEQRRVGNRVLDGQANGADISVLAPEDTNTRLVLREAVARNAAVSFAVQLQWSVQPIDVKSVPQHPIFQAYALYAAEGRRTGRAWFFLRLGFFSDAVSAKQVAHYLRRDFASAAVVPVSPQERAQVGKMGHCSEVGTIARRPGRRIG